MSHIRNSIRPSEKSGPAIEPPAGGQRESTRVAEYIASMTRSLSGMAGECGLQTLSFLLDMTRLEAESIARKPPPS